MKKIALIAGLLLFSYTLFSQVGIGTTSPTGALEVSAVLPSPSTQMAGFVPPTVSLSATNSTLTTTAGSSVVNANTGGVPTNGTIVYNTSTSGAGANQVTPGYYYWDNGVWTSFKSNGKTISLNQSFFQGIGPSQAATLGLNGYQFATVWTPATSMPRLAIGGAGDGAYYESSTTTLADISLKGWILSTSNQPSPTTVYVMKYSLGTTAVAYGNTVIGVSLGSQLLNITANNMYPVDLSIASASLLPGDVLVCVLVNNTTNQSRTYQFGGQLQFTK
jgi:hypothetical protein